MSETPDVDFGPLQSLIGVWKGGKGVDIAPEPDEAETNPYFETITYGAVGGVRNAGIQNLAAIHYRQIVQRQSNGEIFHHQAGYWMWDRENQTVMHSLIIPRAVCVLAGGKYLGQTDADGRVVMAVAARLGDDDWTITQSPFMRENAATTAFRQDITVGKDTLIYSQTTMLKIYGKTFEHTDQNELVGA